MKTNIDNGTGQLLVIVSSYALVFKDLWGRELAVYVAKVMLAIYVILFVLWILVWVLKLFEQ